MSADHRGDDPGALKRPPEQSEKRSGNPPDPLVDDPIERLGKRIGRILSYLLAAALVFYLWHTYLRG